MTFSMNPDPASWIEVEDATVAFDQYPDGSFAFRLENVKDYFAQGNGVPPHRRVTLKSTLPQALVALNQVASILTAPTRGDRLHLVVQTFPDQRGDKSVKDGECVAVAATIKLMSIMGFAKITVHDVHSTRTIDELERRKGYAWSWKSINHVSGLTCFGDALVEAGEELPTNDAYVVAVDNGAIDRVHDWAERYNAAGIIYASKKRDENGKIIGHTILADAVGGSDVKIPLVNAAGEPSTIWVIDDLCDGGMSFISIAKALRKKYDFGRLGLYTTHGIYSRGRDVLYEHFDVVLSRFSYDEWRQT